jgi:hypothetical protein
MCGYQQQLDVKTKTTHGLPAKELYIKLQFSSNNNLLVINNTKLVAL